MDDFSENLFESIVDHRLGQRDLDRLLQALSDADRVEFMDEVGSLIKRIGAFVEVSQEPTGSPSLDELLPRLMGIVTESLLAERSSLFVYDRETDELFTRVAQGDGVGEIRIPADAGIAGAVFKAGKAEIIGDVYADPRFNPAADKATGFRTRDVLCAPVKGREGPIGVVQALNKRIGSFNAADVHMLEALAAQAASALEYARMLEIVEQTRREEAQMLDVVNAISSELQLDALLARIISVATDILHADRGSLFLYDPQNDQLWSRVAEGLETKEIRFPSSAGIAGEVFTSRAVLNIPDAYADARFNQAFDQKTGYRTRSILCVPIIDKTGDCTGVVQILNKAEGPFDASDVRRLQAFASQAQQRRAHDRRRGRDHQGQLGGPAHPRDRRAGRADRVRRLRAEPVGAREHREGRGDGGGRHHRRRRGEAARLGRLGEPVDRPAARHPRRGRGRRDRDWPRARRAFGLATALAPDDTLSQMYLTRVERLETDPPGADWDGVWTLSTK